MKKPLQYLLLLCFFSSISLALAAQDRPGPKMRKELHTYMQKNVMPVLKEHRKQLDNQMTAADRRKVEKLRQELKQLENQRAQLRKDGPRHHVDLTEEQLEQLKTMRETRHRIYTEAGALASKYRPQLERINTSLSSHKTTWEKEFRSIAAQADTESEGRRFNRRPPRHEGRLMNIRHFTRPANFILWDIPSITAPENLGTAARNTIFPNPTLSSNTISYAVEQSGPVKITLLNAQGTNMRELLHEQKATGDYSLDVSAQNLPNGIYFYRIETKSGVETLRFLKR